MQLFTYDWRAVKRPLPPDFYKGTLDYVVAVPEDKDFILDFLKTEYIPRQELLKAIGMPIDLACQRYEKLLDKYLKQPYSIMGFLNNELILVSINSIEEMPYSPERYRPYVWTIKPDYGPDLKKISCTPNIVTKYDLYRKELDSGIDQMFPDCKKLFYGGFSSVKAEYNNQKIFVEFVQIPEKMAIHQMCDYKIVVATSKKTFHITKKSGFQIAKEFPPWKFIVNGEKVFNCGPDDQAMCVLMIKNIKEEIENLKNKL